ncbi:MAG: hypothetical protein U0841_18010 [Chloroflexia bacterium]
MDQQNRGGDSPADRLLDRARLVTRRADPDIRAHRCAGPLQSLPLGPTTIGGIAFAGDRGISRVEVSTDDGTTWRDAELEPALGPTTWVRWSFPWTPTRTGKHTLVARARDGNGTPQTPTARKPGPGGATGYDRRDVTVAG